MKFTELSSHNYMGNALSKKFEEKSEFETSEQKHKSPVKNKEPEKTAKNLHRRKIKAALVRFSVNYR